VPHATAGLVLLDPREALVGSSAHSQRRHEIDHVVEIGPGQAE